MSQATDNSLIEFLLIVARARNSVARLAVATASVAMLVLVLLPREFSSVATFLPSASTAAGSPAMALAAQFGVAIGAAAGDSPEFYAELINSREFRYRLVDHRYSVLHVPIFGAPLVKQGTLVDILDLEDEDPAMGRFRAFDRLPDLLSVTVGRMSGTVTVVARTEYPDLSYQLVDESLRLLDDFNRNRRSSQARQERQFVESRLEAEKMDLRRAEVAMEEFLRANRMFEGSPELSFRHINLQQELLLRRQIFQALSSSYEQARIEEVRTTPVVTLVQSPVPADLPDPRRLLLKALLAILLGVGVGITAVIVVEFVKPKESDDRDAREALSVEIAQFVAELKRPWLLLRRRG